MTIIKTIKGQRCRFDVVVGLHGSSITPVGKKTVAYMKSLPEQSESTLYDRILTEYESKHETFY